MTAKFHIQDGIRLRNLREFVEVTAKESPDAVIRVGVLKTTSTFRYEQPYTIETLPTMEAPGGC